MKIVQQGYRDTEFVYIIQQGRCSVSVFDRVSVKHEKMQDIHVRNLGPNQYFGEISVVHDSVRTATVTTENYCTMGKIGLETIYNIC